MWELQMQLIEFFSKISSVKIFCIVIIFSFLFHIIIRVRKLSYLLLILYIPIFILSFTFKNYGIDSIRWVVMKAKLSPVAYMSYRQDLELMKTLRGKRSFSIFTYKNMERLNKEFEEILDFLEREKENKLELEKIEKERLNII